MKTYCMHCDGEPCPCYPAPAPAEGVEERAWAHLQKESPWTAKDDYYKKNPTKSHTYNAFLAGASSGARRERERKDAENAALKERVGALEYELSKAIPVLESAEAYIEGSSALADDARAALDSAGSGRGE